MSISSSHHVARPDSRATPGTNARAEQGTAPEDVQADSPYSIPAIPRARQNVHHVPPSASALNPLSIPLEYILVGALVLNLASGRLSLLFILLSGGVYIFYRSKPYLDTEASGDNDDVRPGEGREAVDWINHALYALFPLVSTDILTPFIDLLEDALIQQVPPIVTSVRLTSPALGSHPVVLTSLRPLSDEEWFVSLTPPADQENQSCDSPRTNNSPPKHSRTGSSMSTASGNTGDETLGPAKVVVDAEERKKRDRTLRTLARNKQTAAATELVYDGPDLEEDDSGAGQYVNYQVGFEYKTASSKKGFGLHVLVGRPL